MKTAITCVVSSLFLSLGIGSAYAEGTEVEPTEKEFEYMEKLDGDMTEKFGGTDSVEGRVTESPEGKRTIHLDYSDSKGMEIKGGK